MDECISNVQRKSWAEVRQGVRELRRQISCLSSRIPSSFTFRQLSPALVRIYFLCSPGICRETTIFYCDVDTSLRWYVYVVSSLTSSDLL